MDYKIREIEEKDFATLISLFQEFALFEKLPEKMTNSLEQMKAEKQYLNGFVATTPTGEIAGYVTCFFAYYTWIGKSMYMDDLYVRKEFRGQGIGSLLINRVINLAKANQCKKLRWQVSEWNAPAIDFYKNLGASVDGTESNCDLVF
jgi:GNAT superfamily N-acetyltransferase